MKYLTAFAIFALAAMMGIMSYVFYKSSKETAQKVQESVNTAAAGTSNLNDLAGTVNGFLKTLVPSHQQ